jgi:hypothetical protein
MKCFHTSLANFNLCRYSEKRVLMAVSEELGVLGDAFAWADPLSAAGTEGTEGTEVEEDVEEDAGDDAHLEDM